MTATNPKPPVGYATPKVSDSAFGFIGMLIGPVILTVAAALLRFLDETPSSRP